MAKKKQRTRKTTTRPDSGATAGSGTSKLADALFSRTQQAILYGSTAKGTDTAFSDVDLLIVSDDLTLEQVYAAIAPAERELARKINPTLYTTEEFQRRRKAGDSFVTKVLTGEHIVLAGSAHETAATR